MNDILKLGLVASVFALGAACGSEPERTGVAPESDATAQSETPPSAEQTKSDTIAINLDYLEEVEYKALLDEGSSMKYTWTVAGDTENGGVYYDFHGDAGSEETPPPDSYEEGEAPTKTGEFEAPFDGYHGWYFLNIEERPITITLEIEGAYQSHKEIYRGSQLKSQ